MAVRARIDRAAGNLARRPAEPRSGSGPGDAVHGHEHRPRLREGVGDALVHVEDRGNARVALGEDRLPFGPGPGREGAAKRARAHPSAHGRSAPAGGLVETRAAGRIRHRTASRWRRPPCTCRRSSRRSCSRAAAVDGIRSALVAPEARLAIAEHHCHEARDAVDHGGVDNLSRSRRSRLVQSGEDAHRRGRGPPPPKSPTKFIGGGGRAILVADAWSAPATAM